MANGHGGARVPRNPAPVSGPGAMSARTDGQAPRQLDNAGYGEQKAFQEIQGGAPMATAPSSGGSGGGGGGDPLAALTGMGAPSGMPNVPITDGAAFGAGAGPEALGLPQSPQQERAADVAALHPGLVQSLLVSSMREDASPSFKRLVRTVLANQ